MADKPPEIHHDDDDDLGWPGEWRELFPCDPAHHCWFVSFEDHPVSVGSFPVMHSLS